MPPLIKGSRSSRPVSDASIIVIDDDRTLCEVLRQLIERIGTVAWAGAAHTLAGGIELHNRVRPSIVVLDLDLPDAGGWEFFEHVKTTSRVVVFSGYLYEASLVRLHHFPVAGYMEKPCYQMEAEWREMIACMQAGRRYFSPNVKERIESLRGDSESWHRYVGKKQMSVLSLMGEGLRDDEIGVALGIKTASVQGSYHRVMKKLGFSSKSDLLQWAFEVGFIRSRLGSAHRQGRPRGRKPR